MASYLHGTLVGIHPFADGNGRCARLVQNLALLLMGCPPIVQRHEDRIAYFGALDALHVTGDIVPLVDLDEAEAALTWTGLAHGVDGGLGPVGARRGRWPPPREGR